MGFAVNFTSCFELGEKGLERAFAFLADKGAVRIFVLADPFITDGGLDSRLHDCRKSGQDFHIHCSYSGEPKQASVQAVLDAARAYHADGLIGIGGGSVLDTAKIVKTCLHTGHDVSHFVMQANPLPAVAEQIPSVMIPTTAGTGSEASGTNILTLENGRKGWVWGPQTKPSLSILDPSFSLSLPPHLTAWTGMDVLVHAFESATNRHTHVAAQLYSHEALRLCRRALPQAVAKGGDLKARSDMLLASYYAGQAIDMCSTSIAHALSHALAALGPVHHGLATALAFEISLPFVLAADTKDMKRAAQAFGVDRLDGLPAQLSDFMDEIGIARSLPSDFSAFNADDLLAVLLRDEMQPMRHACVRWADEKDLYQFAQALLACAK